MHRGRRNFLKLAGSSAGATLLVGCGASATVQQQPTPSATAPPTPTPAPQPAPDPTPQPAPAPAPQPAPDPAPQPAPAPAPAPQPTPPPNPSSPSDPRIAALQAYLRANASADFSLPPVATELPMIAWAGAVGTWAAPAATTLPNGIAYPVSDSRIRIPIFNQYSASLPGNPVVDGFPCLAVERSYVCKGNPRLVGSIQMLRFKTDAPVIELMGVIPDGNGTVQTLIVDGQRVPPKALSCGRGIGGGYNAGTVRIAFGSRKIRDIWIEAFAYFAYLKLDQGDTLLAIDDTAEPQMTAIGDSYLGVRSANFGNSAAVALSLAARLGIRKTATDAIGGTGYWNSGGGLGNLNDRLPAHASDNSDIYLVMAGLNDYGDLVSSGTVVWPSNEAWEQAVRGYLQGLRMAQPGALIVVCAPFCPIPPNSDASSIVSPTTNPTGMGDFLYKASLFKQATQSLAAPWVFIDVLMGTGWLNSSGATGDVTNLQWFTGGTPAPGTTATYKPGNNNGGGGGGFGGIASIPVLTAGRYTQAPDVTAIGGSGSGLLLWANIDGNGNLTAVNVQCPGSGYTDGGGLPTIVIDSTYELSATTLGQPTLLVGINPNGQYPLPSFAPPGVTAADLNNIYDMLSIDTVHPSPVGAEYLGQRLAQSMYDAVMAL